MLRGFIYRKWSKLIHRFGYHYAPAQLMPQPYKPKMGLDGKPIIQHLHWCHWCGLRGTTIKPGDDHA